jgi:hypothetical protein
MKKKREKKWGLKWKNHLRLTRRKIKSRREEREWWM